MDKVEAIEEAVSKISGKWNIKVLFSVGKNAKTFTEIKKEIDKISNKMLSKTLTQLENNSLITKAETVDGYVITEKGYELRKSLNSVEEWVNKYDKSAKRLLVVEDDQNQADLYRKWLENYDVEQIDIEQLHEELGNDILAVILDRDLGGKVSEKYLNLLEASNLPVIMVTGLEPDIEIAEMYIQDYIVKPVSKERLRDAVNDMTSLIKKTSSERKVESIKSRKEILESHIPNSKLKQSEEYIKLVRKLEDL